MEKFKYIIERIYPYLIAACITFLVWYNKIDFIVSKNLNDALNGVISFDAIVIGFLGAIMPVILSMKNESKFVKYVFENDEKDLFKSYLFVTIKLGILNVILTLAVFLRDSYTQDNLVEILMHLWLLSLMSFMFCTMRSMGHMITLLFSKEPIESELIKSADSGSKYTCEELEETRNKSDNE